MKSDRSGIGRGGVVRGGAEAEAEAAQRRRKADDDASGPGSGELASASAPSHHPTPSVTKSLAAADDVVGDRFHIEHLAGEGANSRVFSAREAGTGQRVAIKLLRVRDPSPAIDPSLRLHKQLVSEARSMSRLNHPNLCRVREVSIQGDAPYLVMDWAAGMPLDRAWAKWGRRQRLSMLLRVIDAMAAAHHQGVVHGDLKPANILVRRDGSPTIVDFGLACCEHDDPLGSAMLGGTPGYSAPEQFDPGAQIAPATDVYALGVLLFMMLTDRQPFPEFLAPAMLVEHMKRIDPPLPESIRDDTPPALQRICLCAMECKPGDRYPDAGALAADLRRYVRREAVEARPTILARRFESQRQEQVNTTREWLRLGMVGPNDAGRLVDHLERLRDARSQFLDAGRLSPPRVAAHIGALVVFACMVAATLSEGVSGLEIGSAIVVAVGMFMGGVWLSRQDRHIDSYVALSTSLAGVVALVWLSLVAIGTPSGSSLAQSAAIKIMGAWAPVLPNDPQLLIIAAACAAGAASLRVVCKSPGYTTVATAAGLAAWIIGLTLAVDERVLSALLAQAGMSSMVYAVALTPLGLALDWWQREDRTDEPARQDGAILLTFAAALAPVGAALAAWFGAERIMPDDPFVARGAGFILGSLGTAGIALVLRLRSTRVRSLLASGLVAVISAQLILGLAMLESTNAGGFGWIWLIALISLGLAAAYASSELKTRVLLWSGQAALAIAAVLMVRRIGSEPEALLLPVTLVGGLVTMVLAWWIPAYHARRRVSRWAARRTSSQARSRSFLR